MLRLSFQSKTKLPKMKKLVILVLFVTSISYGQEIKVDSYDNEFKFPYFESHRAKPS